MPLLTDDPAGASTLLASSVAATAPASGEEPGPPAGAGPSAWRPWDAAAGPPAVAAVAAALLGGKGSPGEGRLPEAGLTGAGHLEAGLFEAPLAEVRLAEPTKPPDRWLLWRDDAPRSQFDALQELLAAGVELPDGLACLAATGGRFRGQRGRAWAALRGNLHLCVHLALDLDAAPAQAPLTLLPAVATARAIEAVGGGRPDPRTKWVNDLLWDGRKIAGVLTAGHVKAGRLRHALLGIGVNVARTPDLPADPTAARPASLADADARWAAPGALARLLWALLHEIDAGRARIAAGDGASLLDEYRARAGFLGRRVTIWPVDDTLPRRPVARGVVRALRDDLSLDIEGAGAPVRSGRMTFDEDDGPLAAGGVGA